MRYEQERQVPGVQEGKEMICLACGRLLRSQESRKIGYGPVCYEKLYGKKKRRKRFADRPKDIPGQMDITDFIRG